MNWKGFWSEFPNKFSKECFLQQVGKTYKGKPISDEQFNTILIDIKNKLCLSHDDIVLDLCCGNGLITEETSKQCRTMVGVDFSKPLIDIAKEYHNASNISYYNMSAMDIGTENLIDKQPFTKIYMYEALQHFQENQLSSLLNTLISISNEKVVMLFASVLDIDRIWAFYNTEQLQQEYYIRKQNGELLLGTWWNKSFIEETCNAMNLRCKFIEQPSILHTAHYRFDVIIKKGRMKNFL